MLWWKDPWLFLGSSETSVKEKIGEIRMLQTRITPGSWHCCHTSFFLVTNTLFQMPRISMILLCIIKIIEKKPNPQLFPKQRSIQKWQLCSFQMSLCSTKYFTIIRVLYFNYFISYLIWKSTNQYNNIIFMPREKIQIRTKPRHFK